MTEVLIPVSVGELIDKITILTIKRDRIDDREKQMNIRVELAALERARTAANIDRAAVESLEVRLHAINVQLWDIEDAIRRCEADGDFGPGFVLLARAVYRTNDERAAVKRAINEATGSVLVEEKSYAEYAVA